MYKDVLFNKTLDFVIFDSKKNPEILDGKDTKPFKCTVGWVKKFGVRHNLVDRARTHVAQCNNLSESDTRLKTIDFLNSCKDIYSD